MIVPAGKRVIIRGNNEPLLVSPGYLILDEDLSLQISSNFQPLVGSSTNNNLVRVIGGALGSLTGFGFSGSSKELGYQLWQGSEPITGSFTVTLRAEKNAYTEVWLPATKLLKLPLPLDVGLFGTASDVWGKQYSGVGLIAPGPSVIDILANVWNEVTNENARALNYTRVSIQIGNIYFKEIIFDRVEPVWAKEVQVIDGKAYPIYCRLSISFKTAYSAYQQMISGMDINTVTGTEKDFKVDPSQNANLTKARAQLQTQLDSTNAQAVAAANATQTNYLNNTPAPSGRNP